MSKASNHQIISENIFTQAAHLIANNLYSEKSNTSNYRDCDRLFIDHTNKTFWFTTEKHINHTKKLAEA